jgi:hypothetical protein
MHTFQINALIQFFVSSACTCFELQMFIIRKTISTYSFYGILWYVMVYYGMLDTVPSTTFPARLLS